MSVSFNGLSLTVRDSSTVTKQQIVNFALGWANDISANDPALNWFVFVFDSRDKEFGILYSDGLRQELKLENTYYQLIAPKKAATATPQPSAEPVDYEKLARECIQAMPTLNIPEEQLLKLVTQKVSDTQYLEALAEELSSNAALIQSIATRMSGSTLIISRLITQLLNDDAFSVSVAKMAEQAAQKAVLEQLGSGIQSNESNSMTDDQIKLEISKQVEQQMPSLLTAAITEKLSAALDMKLPALVDAALTDLKPSLVDAAETIAALRVNDLKSQHDLLLTSQREQSEAQLNQKMVEIQQQFQQSTQASVVELNKQAEQAVTSSAAAELAQQALKTVMNDVESTQNKQAQLQQQLEENQQTDIANQKQQASMLAEVKMLLDTVKENAEKISAVVKQSAEFEQWVVSVKASFERLDQFLLNEYDTLKVSLESVSADADLIDSLQNIVLKAQDDVALIDQKISQYGSKIIDAEESDEIEELRHKINEMIDKVNEMGASVSSVNKQEAAVVEEEVVPDEFADPGMV